MAKVHFVQKARKDNPAVKQGEPYFWWKFAFGPKRFSKTRPRPSQLTQSDKLSRVYAVQERLEDFSYTTPETKEQLQSLIALLTDELREVVEEVREVAGEYQESCDNIRDNIPESPTADDCEEKAQALESWADELEQAADNIEGYAPDDLDEPDADADESEQDAYAAAISERFQDVESEFNGVQDCPI